jgi:TusA-related sulfurtransferase
MSMKIKVKIQLRDCGMGMPVIRTWQAMKKLAVGDILQMSSSHP